MIYAGLAVVLLLLVALGLRLPARAVRPRKPVIVVDGSNVMHWGDGVPSIRSLKAVLGALDQHGYAPHVFFDANIGYKLQNRHMSEAALARHLPVGVRAITIGPSGAPADPYLIQFAVRHKCRIVSNDRFRDWRGEFAILRRKGTLVQGDIKGARVLLRL